LLRRERRRIKTLDRKTEEKVGRKAAGPFGLPKSFAFISSGFREEKGPEVEKGKKRLAERSRSGAEGALASWRRPPGSGRSAGKG